MARLKLNVSSGAAVALVSATAKTILQVKAPANQQLAILGIHINATQPAGGVDEQVLVRGTRSSANFGTAGAAITPNRNGPGSETPQGTYGRAFSVEPTTPTDANFRQYYNPQQGLQVTFLDRDVILVPGGTAYNFEFTSVAGTPSVEISVFVEE